MSAEKQAKLRHAIANCAKVEMIIKWLPGSLYRTCSDKRWRFVERAESIDGYTWTNREWVCTLTKGGELDEILNKLSSVPQWFTPLFDKGILINPGRVLSIRLLDAEGKELYSEGHAYGPWTSCMGEQGERVSFKNFFPEFPARECFEQ